MDVKGVQSPNDVIKEPIPDGVPPLPKQGRLGNLYVQYVKSRDAHWLNTIHQYLKIATLAISSGIVGAGLYSKDIVLTTVGMIGCLVLCDGNKVDAQRYRDLQQEDAGVFDRHGFRLE